MCIDLDLDPIDQPVWAGEKTAGLLRGVSRGTWLSQGGDPRVQYHVPRLLGRRYGDAPAEVGPVFADF